MNLGPLHFAPRGRSRWPASAYRLGGATPRDGSPIAFACRGVDRVGLRPSHRCTLRLTTPRAKGASAPERDGDLSLNSVLISRAWPGWRESNPHLLVWKQPCYHYTLHPNG